EDEYKTFVFKERAQNAQIIFLNHVAGQTAALNRA
ncbi:MAG: hypothetical protein QOE55_8593, partial [Acidobacteriaceae bacterium]|nr:hypothetical protein [Acidobacteriaceae bacterium]